MRFCAKPVTVSQMSSSQPSRGPGRPRRASLDKREVIGLPQLRLIDDLLDHLRSVGEHPNRKLYFDDLFIGLLLAFYNPIARSLRGIEDASQMPGVNQHMDIKALRRSTVSDAVSAFDAQLLLPLITHLRQQVSDRQIDHSDSTLRGMLNRLIIFDGSYFRTAADVSWAMRERHGKNGKLRARVRLNLHLAAKDGLPVGVSIAGQDDPSEPVAMLENVEAGQIVVADRGCFSHQAVDELLKQRVDLVLRLQKTVRCNVLSERSLTPEDREAGVIADQIVETNGCKNPRPKRLRLVTIQPESDSSRNEEACDPSPPSPLRLLTNIEEEAVDAWMIGHLYRRRWDIELFFRWLKRCATCDHLLSESHNGMMMQMYVALIGTLLLSMHTGRKPDKYTFNLMAMVAAGQGSLQDALEILKRRHAERDRARERRERKRQKPTS